MPRRPVFGETIAMLLFNLSGNFTKVVQRLPIRISIDPAQPLAPRLRPGMSVIVMVDTAADGREPVEATP